MRFLEREDASTVRSSSSGDDSLPSAQRRRGLATPERAVLLAYAKLWLYDEILASTLPDDPWVAKALVDYFPPRCRALRRLPAAPPAAPRDHRQRGGEPCHQPCGARSCTGCASHRRQLGGGGARAHARARGLRAARGVARHRGARHAGGGRRAGAMLIDTGRLATRGTLWFLRSPGWRGHGGDDRRFGPGVASLAERVFDLLPGASRDEALRRATELESARVPRRSRGASPRSMLFPARPTSSRPPRRPDTTSPLSPGCASRWATARAGLAVATHRGAAGRGSLAGTGAGRAARRRRRVAARADHRRAARGAGDVAAEARLAAWESAHRAARDRALKWSRKCAARRRRTSRWSRWCCGNCATSSRPPGPVRGARIR